MICVLLLKQSRLFSDFGAAFFSGGGGAGSGGGGGAGGGGSGAGGGGRGGGGGGDGGRAFCGGRVGVLRPTGGRGRGARSGARQLHGPGQVGLHTVGYDTIETFISIQDGPKHVRLKVGRWIKKISVLFSFKITHYFHISVSALGLNSALTQ